MYQLVPEALGHLVYFPSNAIYKLFPTTSPFTPERYPFPFILLLKIGSIHSSNAGARPGGLPGSSWPRLRVALPRAVACLCAAVLSACLCGALPWWYGPTAVSRAVGLDSGESSRWRRWSGCLRCSRRSTSQRCRPCSRRTMGTCRRQRASSLMVRD